MYHCSINNIRPKASNTMEVMGPRLLLKYINATNIINIIRIIAPKNLLDLVDKKYCNQTL